LRKLSWISKNKVANKHANVAIKELKKATQLLRVYYPILEDPKVFLQVIQSMHVSVIEGMLAVIAKKGRKVQSKDSMVIIKVYQKYCSKRKEINLAVWLTTLLRAHKNSPLSFRRKEMYVICNDSLEMVIVTQEKLLEQMERLEVFVKQLEKKVNGRLPRRR
jgi:hypothetical protein